MGPFPPARQPPSCGDTADSAWALASLCSNMALRVGHRAKPGRWRQSHSFIHLANIYLTPPMCRTPCRLRDPVVKMPGSQTQSTGAGWGLRQIGVGTPARHARADPCWGDIQTQDDQVSFSKRSQKPGFCFQMNFPVIFKCWQQTPHFNHHTPNETYLRGESSSLATHLGLLGKWDEGA